MITMIGGWIAVEQADKVKKDKSRGLGENPFLDALNASNNYGKIAHIKYQNHSDKHLPIGTLVYFGNAFEKIIMDGHEVLIMKEDNIFAIAKEG